jgi:hypothetical protein
MDHPERLAEDMKGRRVADDKQASRGLQGRGGTWDGRMQKGDDGVDGRDVYKMSKC